MSTPTENRVLRFVRHNLIAMLALFVALGGTSYAAVSLPKDSVTTKAIKKSAVTSAKVKNGSLMSEDFRAGQLPRGAQGERGPQGDRGPQGERGAQGERGEAGTSAFASAVPSGKTVTGFFGHQTPLAAGKSVKFGVSLPIPAPQALSNSDVNFAAGSNGENDPTCTGSRHQPTAPRGKVCLYYSGTSGTAGYSGEADNDNRHGFFVQMSSNGANNDYVSVAGSWAYTAP